MVKDAEAHATEDEAKRKLIDVRNRADQLVYTTEKMVKDYGDKVDAGTRTEIEQAVNRLKDVQKGDDVGVIERAIDEVTTKSHKLGEAVYKASSAAKGAPGSGPTAAPSGDVGVGEAPKPGGKDDDVIDAEFEVKK
jgi:molecular chaperone DnaK